MQDMQQGARRRSMQENQERTSQESKKAKEKKPGKKDCNKSRQGLLKYMSKNGCKDVRKNVCTKRSG